MRSQRFYSTDPRSPRALYERELGTGSGERGAHVLGQRWLIASLLWGAPADQPRATPGAALGGFSPLLRRSEELSQKLRENTNHNFFAVVAEVYQPVLTLSLL